MLIPTLKVAARIAFLLIVASACAAARHERAGRGAVRRSRHGESHRQALRIKACWHADPCQRPGSRKISRRTPASRPDGTITRPVFGELTAAGRTAAELQRDVAQRLATIVRDAVVTVSVLEVKATASRSRGNAWSGPAFHFALLREGVASTGTRGRAESAQALRPIRS